MKNLLALSFLLLSTPFILFPQDIDMGKAPPWLLMELGEKAFREKEFGEALVLFREAKKRMGVYPEADLWIGLVFEADAEIELAVKQIERAYADRNQLYIIAEKYTILYKLAELYRMQADNSSFENRLSLIIDDDTDFADKHIFYPFLNKISIHDFVSL